MTSPLRPADGDVPVRGDADAAPPPPERYEEPVAGPAGRVLTRTVSFLFAPVLGLAAGGCAALVVRGAARVVARQTGGEFTSPAIIALLCAGLLWGAWRGALRMRDGSVEISPVELCIGCAMLPVFLTLILAVSTVVYALQR